MNEVKRQRHGRPDALHGLTIDSDKVRSQHFVSSNDFIDAPLKRHQIKRSAKSPRAGNIVSRAPRFKLVDKPQALLGE
jgi:hypothetical protein